MSYILNYTLNNLKKKVTQKLKTDLKLVTNSHAGSQQSPFNHKLTKAFNNQAYLFGSLGQNITCKTVMARFFFPVSYLHIAFILLYKCAM